jgi:CubicO group peptidase (beta-lactamase class C family)
MNSKLFLSLVIGVLISQMSFAQTFDGSKLDTYFEALNSNNKFMGSVAVSQKGKLLYTKFVGFADIEQKLRANENSKYRIGSISKTFTTVLVLSAVEKNKLNLNQTIDKYFPSIPNASKITISQLLYHRSGIHNFTNDKSYLDWNTQPKTEKEMIEIISRAESDFEPDSKAGYSNSNFVLLTYIVEKTYKKSYAKLIEEKIAKPIGLRNTYVGTKINTQNGDCNSYHFSDSWKIEAETDMSIPMGAGAIVSTATDLTKFIEALFNGKLLSRNSVEQMKTLKDNLGMGLFRMPFYDKTGYGHTGVIDGFSSIVTYFPEDDISVALISNGLDYNLNDMTIAGLSAVYNKPFDIPAFKTYQVTTEDLDKYLGVYSSNQIPIKLTITKDDTILFAQGTGQPSFPLEATEKDKFKFDKAGVILEFNPAENTMLLKQGGGQFTFTKDN